MSIFKVKIIETLESEVSIEANNLSESIQEAKERWHILSPKPTPDDEKTTIDRA